MRFGVNRVSGKRLLIRIRQMQRYTVRRVRRVTRKRTHIARWLPIQCMRTSGTHGFK